MYLVAKGSVIAAFATCVAAASNPQGSFNCVQSLCQFVPASPSTEAGTEKWSGFENLIVLYVSLLRDLAFSRQSNQDTAVPLMLTLGPTS